VIAGFTTFEHIEIDLSIMDDLTLTEPEKMELQREAALPGLYCQGCRQCLQQCPQKLPIPDLMRAYMYTYDYRSIGHARDLIASLDLPDGICGDCSLCSVNCAVGFNIKKKVQDMGRLRMI